MRDIIWATIVLAFSYLAFTNGHTIGWREADRHYAALIQVKVSAGIAGYQRVQKIREQASYQKGWTACMEQF